MFLPGCHTYDLQQHASHDPLYPQEVAALFVFLQLSVVDSSNIVPLNDPSVIQSYQQVSLKIIDAVGSENVRVHYDRTNSYKMDYDIYHEIRWLGNKHIGEFHMKENRYLLGEGRIDFEKLRKAIDDMEYSGWVVIEGARPDGKSIDESYQALANYIHKFFR